MAIPAFEQGLEHGSRHAAIRWKRCGEGGGRLGPEDNRNGMPSFVAASRFYYAEWPVLRKHKGLSVE